MHSLADGKTRRSFWLWVRQFAVPPDMIRLATARRLTGDWAGACAAARVDDDLDLRHVSRVHGGAVTARIRADLRVLAPDLLRWHMPRVAPDGLLRPGLTVSLARYDTAGLQLVARTPPGWASGGQRISLALWDGLPGGGDRSGHPHPRPDPWFRLDLHRHLWAADRSADLRLRSGAAALLLSPGDDNSMPGLGGDALPGRNSGGTLAGLGDGGGLPRLGFGGPEPGFDAAGPVGGEPPSRDRVLDPDRLVPDGAGCAVDRWADEARLVLGAVRAGTVAVRLPGRRRILLHVPAEGDVVVAAGGRGWTGPVLPAAATYVPPDVELLRDGLVTAADLHPLVSAALLPGFQPGGTPSEDSAGETARIVDCRGARHRIAVVGGVLVPLDHDPAELRREELLVAFGGPPLPCLRAIDDVHRRPEDLADVRARLEHGDAEGALSTVESLLGPGAMLRHGALRDVLEEAADRLVDHGLFRAGLANVGPPQLRRDGMSPVVPVHRPRRRRHS